MDRLRNAFPSVDSWFRHLTDPQKCGVMESWRLKLEPCDLADVADIVDEFIDGRQELPQRYDYDRLANVIRVEARARRAARVESLRVRKLTQPSENDKPHHARAQRWRFAMSVAMDLGVALHLGEITDEENTRGVDAVDRWMRTGEGDPPELPEDTVVNIDRWRLTMQP